MTAPEPDITQGKNPEAQLHNATVAEVHYLLRQAGATFILIEKFGLDVGIFIEHDGRTYTRFIEVKAFVGSRAGGVGFGNGKGEGPQVDLLLHSPSELSIVDSSVLWLLGLGNQPKGSARYAVFTSIGAKKAAMGDVQRGKQNNLRVADFRSQLITWAQVTNALHQFVL